jgi:hypothetical protein
MAPKKPKTGGPKSVKSTSSSSGGSGVHELHLPDSVAEEYKKPYFGKGKMILFPATDEDTEEIPGDLIRKAQLRETEPLVLYTWDEKDETWDLSDAVAFGAWFGTADPGRNGKAVECFKTRCVFINRSGKGKNQKIDFVVRTLCIYDAQLTKYSE